MNNTLFTAGEFQVFLREHKVMGARCTRCGALYLPPRPLCPHCVESTLEWVEFSGRGKLVGFSVIAIGLTAMLEAGYSRENPYCSAFVQLEEGPVISVQLVGVDVLHPELLKPGMALRATFVERGSEEARKTFLAFEPWEGGEA